MMPYRNAHWWVLALAPLIGLAFWPTYFSHLRDAPFALHAHGITACLWITLVAIQRWTIAGRRNHWHRRLGFVTFALVPAFAAGGALAMQAMAALFVTRATPFHSLFGARLTIADGVAAPVLVGLVAYGLIERRRVKVHAAALLATVVLVLPPVLGRLVGWVPGAAALADELQVHPFVIGFHGGEAAATLIALWLGRHGGRDGRAFRTVAIAGIVQMIGFETLGRTPFWERSMSALIAIPPGLLALAAAAAALAVLWWAWRRVPPRRAAATGPVPAAA